MNAYKGPVKTGEIWRINPKEKLTGVHLTENCIGGCPLHNPSEHSMSEATLHWRQDAGIFERLCEHGIGHPDPDSVAHFEAMGAYGFEVHGCDGCCGETE